MLCLKRSSKTLGGTNHQAALTLNAYFSGISNAQWAASSDVFKSMLATKFGVPTTAISFAVLSSASATNCKVAVTIQGVDPIKFTQTALNETAWSYKQLLNSNLCAGINCGAHGSCSGGRCYCRDGYTGTRCQTPPVDPCANVNCGANGTCNNGTCVCTNGYSGSSCQTPPVPAWTRILHCDQGNSSVNRLDYSPATIEQLAQTATQVKICTKDQPTSCEISAPNSFPIQMLRQGKTISMNNGQPCNQTCVQGVWSGPSNDRMWNTCTDSVATTLAATPGEAFSGNGFYWACNNGSGLHISAADNGHCEWDFASAAGDNLEVFINTTSRP